MPAITLSDLSLKEHSLTPRVAACKDTYFRAVPEICTERALLVTQGSLAQGLLGKPRITCLDKARLYRYVLEQRQPIVRHRSAVAAGMVAFSPNDRWLFAGSTTARWKGVPLYPEFTPTSDSAWAGSIRFSIRCTQRTLPRVTSTWGGPSSFCAACG